MCYSKAKHLFEKKPKKKTKESGRSMVEMLAVLAVIGVLSALGVMGYRYAMVKNETNNLIYELNMCSTIVATSHVYHPDEEKPDITECLGGVLDKYDMEVGELFTVDGVEGEFYEFTLHHVSDEVVAEFLHMNPSFIGDVKVNGKSVNEDEVVSYHKPLFIKSAYAGGDNTLSGILSIDPDDDDVPLLGGRNKDGSPCTITVGAAKRCQNSGGIISLRGCTCSCPTGQVTVKATSGDICCSTNHGPQCGNTCCGVKQSCWSDVCVDCPEGKVGVGSICCDEDHGPQCGEVCCDSNEVCGDDGCQPCPTGKVAVDGICCDTNHGPKCGDICCASGKYCNDGSCKDCPTGKVAVDGICCDTNHGPKCGDMCCNSNQACIEGMCITCSNKGQVPVDGKTCCDEDHGPVCGLICCKPGQYCEDDSCEDCPTGQTYFE